MCRLPHSGFWAISPGSRQCVSVAGKRVAAHAAQTVRGARPLGSACRALGDGTGEPGIGKTAVVEAFATQVAAGPQVCVAWGQCVEHLGAGEAYMPVLGLGEYF